MYLDQLSLFGELVQRKLSQKVKSPTTLSLFTHSRFRAGCCCCCWWWWYWWLRRRLR